MLVGMLEFGVLCLLPYLKDDARLNEDQVHMPAFLQSSPITMRCSIHRWLGETPWLGRSCGYDVRRLFRSSHSLASVYLWDAKSRQDSRLLPFSPAIAAIAKRLGRSIGSASTSETRRRLSAPNEEVHPSWEVVGSARQIARQPQQGKDRRALHI